MNDDLNLTADQLRDLRNLDRDLVGAAARLVDVTADARDARADYDAARKAILAYLHDCLTPDPPPALPLFDDDGPAPKDAAQYAEPEP